MILSRSTRRRPTWGLGDILPASETAWRGVALVALSLSTMIGMAVAVFGYLVWPIVHGEYREGNSSLAAFALALAVYGAFVAGPTLGWIFAARVRYRLAVAAALAPAVLFGAMGVVALVTR